MEQQNTDWQDRGTDLRLLGPPWLTVESGLYVLFLILGAFLRLYALSTQPLQEEEARLALDAWHFSGGGVAQIRGHSPLLFHAGALSYLLFGTRDFVIRLFPALAGTSMVGLPYLLRPQLGRRGALAASALLAVSPSFVFFSRQANGDIVLAAALLALISGLFGYGRGDNSRQLYIVSAALAIAVLASGATLVPLLVLAGFWLAPIVYSRLTRKSASSSLQQWLSERPHRTTALRALGLFAALAALMATGLLVNLHGLQAALDLFSGWLARFAPVADPLPWHYYLSLLLVYELPILVFGVAGASYLWRRDTFSTFLVCWLGVSLLLYSLMGNKPPSGILLILLPLTLLAGRAIADLLYLVRESQQWAWTRLLVLICLPALFLLLIQLAAFGDPNNPGDPRNLMLALLSLFFIACLVLTAGLLALDWRSAIRSGGLVALVLLGGLMFRSSWRLNQAVPANAFEILSAKTTCGDVRNLTRALEDLSNQQEGQRHTIDIAVTGGEDPLLAWYLKDFKDLSFVSEVSSAPPRVVITPFPASENLPNYTGARYRLQSSWRGEGLMGHDLVNWYLFRESLQPPTHTEVVMWVAPEQED
ncbi:MAG: TIGR03663 family protein [Anaerolineae bacterium]|nr:TIGR03663 family protein [Anaerolineae bacterium]